LYDEYTNQQISTVTLQCILTYILCIALPRFEIADQTVIEVSSILKKEMNAYQMVLFLDYIIFASFIANYSTFKIIISNEKYSGYGFFQLFLAMTSNRFVT
jgi:hypothetical protein